MYQADYSQIYDAIYESRGKDYRVESMEVADLVHARKRDASTMLDVACGTGGHLRFLRQRFDHTAGLDISSDMLAVAQTRFPGIPMHQGDMRDFALTETYDAVICMFSSIGYLRSTADLNRAVDRLANHLEPNGVLVIEPWFFPEYFIPGYIAADVVRCEQWAASRVSHSVRTDNNVDITVHYVIAEAQKGVRHLTETHPMALFTRQQYENAFVLAGLTVEYLTSDRFPCGLFTGMRR